MIHCDPSALSPARLKTILIVDDDIHFAETLAHGLEANGYRTLRAANIAVGWKLAHAHLPELILSDIDMPGGDGRRLLAEMRADPELGNRQFVLMTGLHTLANPRTVMDLGADDILMKPFALPELVRCIEARFKRAELSRHVNDEALNRLSHDLSASLPYEFFTPLVSILGLSDLCPADLEKRSRAEIHRDLREIHTAGQQLYRKLRNYVLILELDPPAKPRLITRLKVPAVADALCDGAAVAAARHGRAEDVRTEVEAAMLHSNPADLATIVDELVDNALSFSRQRTPVQLRAWRDGTVLQIVVTDAGRGLTVQQLEFLQMYWEKPRDTHDRQNLGLGLIVVRRLVHSLGGQFRLESRDGMGTSAYVTLPIDPG